MDFTFVPDPYLRASYGTRLALGWHRKLKLQKIFQKNFLSNFLFQGSLIKIILIGEENN